jgi:hypothetical protein
MKMGCCFSCHDDEEQASTQVGDGDRRPLIDPVSNSSPVVIVPRSDSLAVGEVSGQSTRGQEDELAKILQETASAMIDVSCAGSHSLDQREFQERSRTYLHKIQALNPSLLVCQPSTSAKTSTNPSQSPIVSVINPGTPVSSSPLNTTACGPLSVVAPHPNALSNPSSAVGTAGTSSLLIGDVPNPEKHLGLELISDEDLELMHKAMDDVETALHSIRIEYNDDLVVPFGSDYSQAASPSSDRMVMVSD